MSNFIIRRIAKIVIIISKLHLLFYSYWELINHTFTGASVMGPDTFGALIPPFGGLIPPFGGLIPPFGGLIPPFGALIPPFWGLES